MKKLLKPAALILGSLLIFSCAGKQDFEKKYTLTKEEKEKYTKWTVYNGGNENIKYSSLKQINRKNVKDLKVAWTYNSTQASETNRTDMKVNPLIINGVLYGLNPELKIFALDAATGQEKWVYDPKYIPTFGRAEGRYGQNFNAPGQTHIHRGLSYYDGEGNPMNQRLIYAPGGGHMLIAVDPLNGRPIANFGKDGFVDLHNDGPTDRIIPDKDLHVSLTTPGIVYKDMIIVGSRNNEGLKSSVGHVKAYDVNTGKLRWIFHTIPQPGEFGYDTWPQKEAYKWVGGANVWGGMCLDDQRGIVYAMTGSTTDDFYGAYRLGDNLFADCILALDANTGERLWHFQMIHHNVWDWDLCANPPALGHITQDGKKRDVVICTSKQGLLYVFDRVTGEPIHPIPEVEVPSVSELPGEQLSKTQPMPTFYEPFSKQKFTEADLLDDKRIISDSSYKFIQNKFRELKSDNFWNPPSKQGTLQIPGFNGGNDWGGASFDPETQIAYIVDNTSPWIVSRIPIAEARAENAERPGGGRSRGPVLRAGMTNGDAGPIIYRQSCQGCHGPDLRGGETNPSYGPIKSLAALKQDLPTVVGIVKNGVGTMPANTELGHSEAVAVVSWILKNAPAMAQKYVPSPPVEEPWYFTAVTTGRQGYNGKFLTAEGYPAIKYPWSEMVAQDMNTGKILWRKMIGGYKELVEKGIKTGAETFGAGAITAGGLIFVSGSSAETIEALDKFTGELLWEAKLPHAAVSTPSVYEVNGKQYVVISCGGGGKQLTKSGDEYVAFTLPE